MFGFIYGFGYYVCYLKFVPHDLILLSFKNSIYKEKFGTFTTEK